MKTREQIAEMRKEICKKMSNETCPSHKFGSDFFCGNCPIMTDELFDYVQQSNKEDQIDILEELLNQPCMANPNEEQFEETCYGADDEEGCLLLWDIQEKLKELKNKKISTVVTPEENKEPPESILLEAEKITGQNNRGYDRPQNGFKKIAAIASAITGKDFTAEDVAYFMIALKLQRETHQHKRDNLVDLCGYANLLMQLKEIQLEKDDK